ncbi:hypothetical protein B0H66DRAFT_601304 [Apodospora peruviana]|uniref:Uncharacterized protein n=1 Tax=Apodospora peruviana TaxID=516989 RepID=A0AAE0IBU4_9PEZI|nr:hypothetical protein B0H66DRAFT_601304 [Apodospora peruviana]
MNPKALQLFTILCVAIGLVTAVPSRQRSQPQDIAKRQQIAITVSPSFSPPSNHSQKVPGGSPAYSCSDSDPADNIFKISFLDFLPVTPRLGYYQRVRFIGSFDCPTGDYPWLTVVADYLDEDLDVENPLFYGPLCDF